jgi:hypothetical protein
MNGDLCGKFSFSGALQQRAGKQIPRKSAVQQRKEVKAWKKEWRGINRPGVVILKSSLGIN